MITKNGSMIFCRSRIGAGSIPANILVKYDGTAETQGISASNVFTNQVSTNNTVMNTGGYDVVMNLGVGDTAPTANDYCLAQSSSGGVDINTLLVCTAANISFSASGSIVYTYVFTNSSNSSITVREAGISVALSTLGKFLLAREVLSSPKTVASGDTVTFSYEIAFS